MKENIERYEGKNSPNSSKFSTQIEPLCIIWHVAFFFLLNASTGVLSTMSTNRDSSFHLQSKLYICTLEGGELANLKHGYQFQNSD